jgi:hypothetical protein
MFILSEYAKGRFPGKSQEAALAKRWNGAGKVPTAT